MPELVVFDQPSAVEDGMTCTASGEYGYLSLFPDDDTDPQNEYTYFSLQSHEVLLTRGTVEAIITGLQRCLAAMDERNKQ